MRRLQLPSGQTIPVLGMGTWRLGERAQQRQQEVKALRYGLELGFSLIDTAEMYGEGGAEAVIAEALREGTGHTQRRSEVFLVSKVYPHNGSKQRAIAACERSLQRLQTDYLDLYLLHWRGTTPIAETMEAFKTLQQAGKICSYGVSNFDVADLDELCQSSGGSAITTNQVLYNLQRRGVELTVLPWCRKRGIPVMAYSPLEQSRLLNHQTLKTIAQARGMTTAQIAIAWLLHQENVIVIPKASRIEHLEQNYATLTSQLSVEELSLLDQAFPAPTTPVPLEVL